MEQLPTTLILVAGGKGLRMGTALPKQFLPLNGKPVLYHATRRFLEVFPAIKIILVLPEEHISYGNILLQAFDTRIDLTIVKGGETRFQSVKNGLKETEQGNIVFIHDAVRPVLTTDLILRCYEQAVATGSAIPCIPVTDSIRQWNGMDFEAIDREKLRSVQTPQTFRSDHIKEAFEQDYKEAFTDEATVMEHMGERVSLVEGAKRNIKITTQEDLVIASTLLNELQAL